MNEEAVRKLTEAVAAALRGAGGEGCCAPESGEGSSPRAVRVELEGCCDGGERSESPRTVVCICAG